MHVMCERRCKSQRSSSEMMETVDSDRCNEKEMAVNDRREGSPKGCRRGQEMELD